MTSLQCKRAVILLSKEVTGLADSSETEASVGSSEDKHHEYVDSIHAGSIVAYYCSPCKARSAKVIKKSSSNKKLLVETKYGMKEIVDFKSVLWVNTNNKWPKWVFNLLKGVSDDKEQEFDSSLEVRDS